MKTLEVFTLTFVVIFSSNVNNHFRWLEGVFSGTLPPRSVHKLRCHKQRFEQWPPQLYKQRWNFFMISVAMTSEPHSNEMTSLPILLATVFLDTGKGFLKSFTGAFSSNSCLNFLEVWAKSMTGLRDVFGINLWSEIQQILDNLDVRPFSLENEALLKCNFT